MLGDFGWRKLGERREKTLLYSRRLVKLDEDRVVKVVADK